MRLLVFLYVTAIALTLSQGVYAQRVDNRSIMGRMERLERDLMLLQRQISRNPNSYDENGYAPAPTPAGIGNMEQRLSTLEEQLRVIQGSIEQVDFQSRQMKTQLDKFAADVEFRLNKLEGAPLAQPAIVPDNQPASLQEPPAAVQTHEGETSDDGIEDQMREEVTPEQEKILQAPSADQFKTPREMYNHGFKLLRQAKHAEAGAVFEGFVQAYPKDPLVGNAHYWLGETYYVRRDYVKASDSYRQGYKANPAGPKAPDNLYKLAASLSALQKTKEACVVLKEMGKKFPESSVKPKADQEINRLGCE